MGAILAGSEERIEEAWQLKFLFGGALRQAGVVAAAMLYALDHNVERLAEDHARAKRLARASRPLDYPSTPTRRDELRRHRRRLDRHRPRGRAGPHPCRRASSSASSAPASCASPPTSASSTTTSTGDRADPTGRSASLQQPEHQLSEILRRGQAEHRYPSLSAAVYRGGEVAWGDAVGIADASGADATTDTQYRIGSITKTFTAASIMLLATRGSSTSTTRSPRTSAGGAPRRPDDPPPARAQLGIQREPPGEVWESLRVPARAELLDRLADAELVLRPRRALPLLEPRLRAARRGRRARSGTPFPDFVDERLIGPLGLTRTTWRSEAPAALGYYVQPFARTIDRSRRSKARASRRSAASGALRPTSAAGRCTSPSSSRCTACR